MAATLTYEGRTLGQDAVTSADLVDGQGFSDTTASVTYKSSSGAAPAIGSEVALRFGGNLWRLDVEGVERADLTTTIRLRAALAEPALVDRIRARLIQRIGVLAEGESPMLFDAALTQLAANRRGLVAIAEQQGQSERQAEAYADRSISQAAQSVAEPIIAAANSARSLSDIQGLLAAFNLRWYAGEIYAVDQVPAIQVHDVSQQDIVRGQGRATGRFAVATTGTPESRALGLLRKYATRYFDDTNTVRQFAATPDVDETAIQVEGEYQGLLAALVAIANRAIRDWAASTGDTFNVPLDTSIKAGDLVRLTESGAEVIVEQTRHNASGRKAARTYITGRRTLDYSQAPVWEYLRGVR